MWTWFSRCVPAFSMGLLVALLLVAFPDFSIAITHLWPWSRSVPPPVHDGHGSPPPAMPLSLAQKLFVGYALALHLNIIGFACRLAWAMSRMIVETRSVLRRRPASKSPASPSLTPFSDSPRISPAAASMPEPTSFEMGSLEEGQDGEVVHVIILPNYSEDLDTLQTTLKVLASHPRASTQYEVVLGMEQKEIKAPEKAVTLISAFQGHFADISATFHPAGLPDEISGKGSNVAWAAKHIVETRAEDESRDVIITVMDADTHLQQDYFNEIRRIHWRQNNDAERSFYASPIIFDRNSNDVPILVRCADLMWAFAGISAMYPGGSIIIPTSVYSLPLVLAKRVGGWDGDANAIGEDMHMLLKCYFETAGDVITHVVASPASQCNIHSSGEGKWSTYSATLFARYRQAMRHMWGALDTGYAIRQSVGSLVGKGSQRSRLKLRHVALLHLLFEAHFLPSHLFILIVFSGIYNAIVPMEELHPVLAWTFATTGFLRGMGFVVMNVVLVFYDRWYAMCVKSRARDMAKAGFKPEETGFSFRKWHSIQQLAERLFFPVAGTLFGPIPAMQTEICHLWTDRLVYRVSTKPTFASLPVANAV